MKREARLLPLFACLGLLLGQSVTAAESDVVAIVNGKKITEGEYSRYTGHGRGGQDAGHEQALQELINIELISADAVSKKYDKDPEFIAAMDEMRRTQLAAFAARKAISADSAKVDAEIKAEYEHLVGEMPKVEYRARHILSESEAGAKEIVAALEKGAKFEELAREKSIDDFGKEGGELGWFTLDQMENSFADALKGLKNGEYTKTPVKTGYGWHVIQLEESRDLAPPPLAQVEGQIRAAVMNKRFASYVEALRAKAKIEIK